MVRVMSAIYLSYPEAAQSPFRANSDGPRTETIYGDFTGI